MNDGRSFWIPGNLSMPNIVATAQQKFGIRAVTRPRFYVIPSTGFDVDTRVVITSQSEWRALVNRAADADDPTPFKVYFVFSSDSPPASMPTTPPRGPSAADVLDDTTPSEPSGVSELERRDHGRCVVCGETPTQVCHIVDQKRTELLFGLDDIDSAGNLVTLCYNHHKLFDDYEFLLVPLSDDQECREFVVTLTGHKGDYPHPGIQRHLGKRVKFAGDYPPLPHLFLAKQLGRFDLKCPHCSPGERSVYTAVGILTHITNKHKEKAQRPLPHPCSRSLVFESAADAFDHMRDQHLNKLYYHPRHTKGHEGWSGDLESENDDSDNGGGDGGDKDGDGGGGNADARDER
jgi:hypothetical protein